MKSAVLLPLGEEAEGLVVFEVNEFLLNADDEDGLVKAETDPLLANNMANAMDLVEGIVDAYLRDSVVDWRVTTKMDDVGSIVLVDLWTVTIASDFSIDLKLDYRLQTTDCTRSVAMCTEQRGKACRDGIKRVGGRKNFVVQ